MEIKTICLLTFLILGVFSQSCCDANTVKVSGNADVKVKPDFATITIGAEAQEKTTSAALQSLNKKISELLNIIRAQRISQKDYSTSSLNIQQVYDYSGSQAVLIGQKASQTLSVKIRDINIEGTAIGNLVDAASKIDGLVVNGVTFDQSDRTLGVTQARKAAFDAAKKKAQEYAQLSDLRVRRVVRISSLDGGNVIPYFTSGSAFSGGNARTLVPVRDVTVSANVQVWFSLGF